LPVIFVTAQDITDVLKEALKLGLDGFIEKPFNLQTVFEIVKEKIGDKNNN
jgi:FixJ family two-component response regulator